MHIVMVIQGKELILPSQIRLPQEVHSTSEYIIRCQASSFLMGPVRVYIVSDAHT